ncbi:hypothetical protein [Paenibacillus flagellatus]|uniref:DUF1643 domain-containing protein n=1 Tax=Paenibacillus flagellatus TaxID=2211139 RepID=A0A2V5JW80_9BACL|nr:hypothetical protein [Paenibacillus flagellatus]PYI51009.1 hypothetical protein DLM86_26965 [Paenibacillus flagellatus]
MFIAAAKLKRRFLAKGRFYKIALDGGIEVRCRSVLDIIRKDYAWEENDPDALVVMMNPGSSTTIGLAQEQEDGGTYGHSQVDLAENIKATPWYDAIPDRTQYQVMRMMSHYGWDYVRVLNLGDIRDVDSDEFIRMVRQYDNPHFSIFSPDRDEERRALLEGLTDKPIVAAWGVSPALEELAVQAMRCLPGVVHGLKGEMDYQYFHPLPRKWGEPRKWLERFLQEVRFEKTESRTS